MKICNLPRPVGALLNNVHLKSSVKAFLTTNLNFPGYGSLSIGYRELPSHPRLDFLTLEHYFRKILKPDEKSRKETP